MSPNLKRQISYYLDPEIGDQYYGEGHPMKPHRVRMTYELVSQYGLDRKLNVYRPIPLTFQEITSFHSEGYMKFLRDVNVETKDDFLIECNKYLGKTEDSDCPIFEGLYRFCQRTAGASVGAAEQLNSNQTDLVINWGGGLHHAKKNQAHGFCYVNDIVLAILRLLRYHQRVLYIDIDVHHGDGVEEAFYTTNRVMTLSFHKGGNFFPGTGKLQDIGEREGRNYAVNVPFHEGIDDDSFFEVFRAVVDRVLAVYRPDAIVLQCGADSLSRDRLGCFNLTTRGHGRCVQHCLNKNLPMLILGGGGYTVKNVARCWAFETAVCLGEAVSNDIPYNDYYEKFGPDYKLHILPSSMENCNSTAYLEKTVQTVFERLAEIEGAPSVAAREGDRPRDDFRGNGEQLHAAENEGEFMEDEGERNSGDLSSVNQYSEEEE